MGENNHKAPYAPLASVQTVIDRMRAARIPDMLDAKALLTMSVPESMAPRTLVALKFLGLLQEDGTHTSAVERVRRASSTEYPGVLEEILRGAYAPVFKIVDPATDSDIAIHDAFRQYEPAAQRDKMVALFMGLCQQAGMVGSDRARAPSVRQQSHGTRQNKAKSETQNKRGNQTGRTDPIRAELHAPGLLFGLTEADAAVLSDDDFNAVWTALGKVARARSLAKAATVAPPVASEEEEA